MTHVTTAPEAADPGVPAAPPVWSLPSGVGALQTRRGTDQGFGFNLADHVGAPVAAVAANRAALLRALPEVRRITWLRQVHGTRVVSLPASGCPEADAAVSRVPGEACAVLTADCLPVLLCDRDATVVAAAHAGWRGLAAGVLEHVVAAMQVDPAALRVWLGPAIGPRAFEVGPEVRAAFIAADGDASACFEPSLRPGRWMADLPGLARRRLRVLGVDAVAGGAHCTFEESAQWFSYRRQTDCGRMASLIWLRPRT
ncbi:peptidoglycan editing factor PgeF [Flagellatimonas centrodinii]|uniref:peptidoglycan editing factor PgeF n=1 Tax=Flagellatimonas centrodinii TaxID=2806210 RepID=UPI003F506A30